MMEKIEELEIIIGLEFGMAVSLLQSAGFLTDDFIRTLPFDKLAELCRANIVYWIKNLALEQMAEQAADFSQWKMVYELSPRGAAFGRDRERRRKALSEMQRLAGDDFGMLYALRQLPQVGGCRADFQSVAVAVENKIYRDCALTLRQALELLKAEPASSALYDKAYRWMVVYVKNEFKDAAE